MNVGLCSPTYRAYSDALTGKVFVSDRGTEMGIGGRQGPDWQANLLQSAGLHSGQYTEAMSWAQNLSEKYGGSNLIFTGHSLGGGLASAQAEVVPGSEGITFNAAGLHANTVAPYNASLSSNQNIQAFYVKGEILSGIQDGSWMAKAALTALFPEVGTALTTMGVGPQAVGERYGLNPVIAPQWATQTISSPYSRSQIYYDNGPMNAHIGDALDLHGQSQVLFALLPKFNAWTVGYNIPR